MNEHTCYTLFYLQVRFQSLSTVVRVATKGGGTNYVTLYRLAFSADCQTFVNLLSGAGNNVVININYKDYYPFGTQ